MQNQNCLLQKFVKIHMHLNKISLVPDFICAYDGFRKDITLCHLIIYILLIKLRKNTQGNLWN
jgi:hypothetical protein